MSPPWILRRLANVSPFFNSFSNRLRITNYCLWSVSSSLLKFTRFIQGNNIHLGKRFQRRRFFGNQPIRKNNGLWRPCLLTDWNKFSKLYRGSSKDASYQVSVHLAKQLQRRRFKKIGQSETRMACGSLVCKRIRTKWAFCIEDIPRMLPTNFWFIWPSTFRGEDVLKINQSETRMACGGHVC
jgi:hypothetical protein